MLTYLAYIILEKKNNCKNVEAIRFAATLVWVEMLLCFSLIDSYYVVLLLVWRCKCVCVIIVLLSYENYFGQYGDGVNITLGLLFSRYGNCMVLSLYCWHFAVPSFVVLYFLTMNWLNCANNAMFVHTFIADGVLSSVFLFLYYNQCVFIVYHDFITCLQV